MSWNQTDRCNLSLTEGVVVFHKVAYIPIFVLGLLLNSMALYMFIRKRASWTETDIYMMNLAVADFALILFLPFRIYDNFNRVNVRYFCKILICIHYLNMYASIFTLTAISVHRFVLVKFPFNARAGGSRKRMALALCILIWVAVVTICSIFGELFDTKNLQSCFTRVSGPLPLRFMLVMFILGFSLPFCTILILSSQTIHSLQKDMVEVTHEEKRKVVAIITANLIVFIVCFVPFHTMLLVKFIVGLQSKYTWNCATYNLVHNIFSVSESIATANCCLDSIGYYFLFRDILH